MIKKAVKDLLPRRLLPRLLLIFLVPLIIIQCSVIFFFYDRHWEKIINRFSNIAGNNLNLIKDISERIISGPGKSFEMVRSTLLCFSNFFLDG